MLYFLVKGVYDESYATLSLLLSKRIFTILHNHYYPTRYIRIEWPTEADLKTISEIHHFQKGMDHRRVLWAIDSLAVYFIDMPYLRSIIDINSPLQEKKPHIILLADHVNHWPLDRRYQASTQVKGLSPKAQFQLVWVKNKDNLGKRRIGIFVKCSACSNLAGQ